MNTSSEPKEQTYTLSSIPPLVGDVTMLVGLEEQEDGSVKVYLGARWKGIYLHVEGESAEDFRRAWGSRGPVFMWPIPSAEVLFKDEVKA